MYACFDIRFTCVYVTYNIPALLHTNIMCERARTFMITASDPYMHKHIHKHKCTHMHLDRRGMDDSPCIFSSQYSICCVNTSSAAATEKARQSASARVCLRRNTARSTQSPPLSHPLTSPSFSAWRCVSATHTHRTHISCVITKVFW